MAQTRKSRKKPPPRPAGTTKPDILMAEGRTLAGLFAGGEFVVIESRARKLLARNPAWGFGWKLLAGTYAMLSRNEEALAASTRAVTLLPGDAEVASNHGNILKDLGRFTEAIAAYRRAIALRPDFAVAHNNLGNTLKNQGDIPEAITAYENALRIAPGFVTAYDNLLFALHYLPGLEGERILELHRRWDRVLNLPPAARWSTHPNTTDPDRTLNIGYVSADLARHPVGIFASTALLHHDRGSHRIFCYSDRAVEDDLSEQLRASCDGWRRTVGMDHREVAELIQADGIDILVDLAGHTAGNRLPVFAMKPAPLQVSWLGYPDTTGLAAMDYLFMDEAALFPGEERFMSEEVVMLPHSRFCYVPPPDPPEVAPLPAASNGFLTFGSFNNLAKVTPFVLDTWARLLQGVPDSRLLLKASPLGCSTMREELTRRFAERGIGSERLLLRGASPHREMLAEYGDMDIALDPFPFGGGLTSCEALWMGVPVLTMAGSRPISRQTAGFLRLAGIDGFIARDEADYVGRATQWSREITSLAAVRAGLRKRLEASPLCDGVRFAADLDAAYRDLWKRWCASRPGGP